MSIPALTNTTMRTSALTVSRVTAAPVTTRADRWARQTSAAPTISRAPRRNEDAAVSAIAP